MTEDRFNAIVEEVVAWFKRDDPRNQREFVACSKSDLITYHHNLGRAIRNHFKLWENPWDPQLENGIDMSPNHPDAISMRVIEAVWEKVK